MVNRIFRTRKPSGLGARVRSEERIRMQTQESQNPNSFTIFAKKGRKTSSRRFWCHRQLYQHQNPKTYEDRKSQIEETKNRLEY